MAQKRMFSNLVVGSDDFLEMPDSSQNLYFHLSMQADDDGFVDNWKSIMRMTGKKEDDLKLLIAKKKIDIKKPYIKKKSRYYQQMKVMYTTWIQIVYKMYPQIRLV